MASLTILNLYQHGPRRPCILCCERQGSDIFVPARGQATEEDADKVITFAMTLWSEQLADGLGEPGEEAAIERIDDWLSNRSYEWRVLWEAANDNVSARDHVRREADLPFAC